MLSEPSGRRRKSWGTIGGVSHGPFRGCSPAGSRDDGRHAEMRQNSVLVYQHENAAMGTPEAPRAVGPLEQMVPGPCFPRSCHRKPVPGSLWAAGTLIPHSRPSHERPRLSGGPAPIGPTPAPAKPWPCSAVPPESEHGDQKCSGLDSQWGGVPFPPFPRPSCVPPAGLLPGGGLQVQSLPSLARFLEAWRPTRPGQHGAPRASGHPTTSPLVEPRILALTSRGKSAVVSSPFFCSL